MSLAILNSDIYNKQQRAMLEENFTTLRSLWFWTCSMPMRVFQIHDPLFLFSAAINIFYLKHIFIVGSCLSCLVNNQIWSFAYVTVAVCIAKVTVVDAKKKTEDYVQFRTLRLLSLFGEMFLWKNLKFYAEMQHTSRNFRQLLNCFENFIVVLRF